MILWSKSQDWVFDLLRQDMHFTDQVSNNFLPLAHIHKNLIKLLLLELTFMVWTENLTPYITFSNFLPDILLLTETKTSSPHTGHLQFSNCFIPILFPRLVSAPISIDLPLLSGASHLDCSNPDFYSQERKFGFPVLIIFIWLTTLLALMTPIFGLLSSDIGFNKPQGRNCHLWWF